MKIEELKKPFPSKDIEWRIRSSGVTNGNVWAIVLAYITSRAIQDRLDEVCGPENWSIRFEDWQNGKGAKCTIGIKIEDEWVYKEDGAENTERESVKGGFSGAVKRAGVQWGIGRYLYHLEGDWAIIHPNGEFRDTAKDKTNNKDVPFKWDPPELPDWALPNDDIDRVIVEGTLSQDKNTERPQQPPPATKDVTPKEFTEGLGRLGIQQTIVAICNGLGMGVDGEKLQAKYPTRRLMLEALSKKLGKDWKPSEAAEEEVKSALDQDKDICELAEKLGFSDVNADFIEFMKTRRRKWDSKVDPVEDQDVEKYRQNLQARASVKASVQSSQSSKIICQGCGQEAEELSTYKDMELCHACYEKQSDKDEQSH